MNVDKSCIVLDFIAFVFPLPTLKIESYLITETFKLLDRGGHDFVHNCYGYEYLQPLGNSHLSPSLSSVGSGASL